MIPSGKITPCVAKKIKHNVTFGVNGDQERGELPMSNPIIRNDDYFWMRSDTRDDPQVIQHLKKENEYSTQIMFAENKSRSSIYKELVSYLKEDSVSSAFKFTSYRYYSKNEKDRGYKIHCRASLKMENEEILLDENDIAEGHAFCTVGSVKISPSHQLLAYAVDTSGDEEFAIYIKDLPSNKIIQTLNVASTGDVTWGKNDQELFYVKRDAIKRPFQVWFHDITKNNHVLIKEELDQLFLTGINKTLDNKYILIKIESSETSEILLIDLSNDDYTPMCFCPRHKGVIYDVDHRLGEFYICNNANGEKKFKIQKMSVREFEISNGSTVEQWKYLMMNSIAIFDHDENTTLDGICCFKDFILVQGRQDTFSRVWVISLNAHIVTDWHRVEFDEECCSVGFATNAEFDTPSVRIYFTSLVSPTTIYDYHIETRTKNIDYIKDVPNYNPQLFESKLIHATANDGVEIPISLVYRKDTNLKNFDQPLHLYGYGSYGVCIDPEFSITRLPLLNRGVVFAIAHVRGGGECGRMQWWEKGAKYLTKRNTFSDFISCAEKLISDNYTSPHKLSIEGRSAGGLLVGAVINMRPDLFNAVIAGVPFVDVMTTMSDPTIPLTVGEWEEWGNPNDSKYFDYMLSYSPVDNIRAQPYPHILATAGLHDPRVAYWEPAKWIAKLREFNTSNNTLLLKVDMDVGHFSASNRYKYLEEVAFDYSFILSKL